MKLLASLLGCAVADYACCPYDEFGVVNTLCPLSEKTPWAMDGSNADPSGVEVHVCKAWEANIDATMEGTDGNADWGGCGFQRHFPWSMKQAAVGDLGASSPIGAAPATYLHCTLGVLDCSDTDDIARGYESIKLGTGFEFDFDEGPFSDSGANMVFGNPHLGGVCKLWIPVRLAMIDSVSIAGVHMNGGGTDGDGGTAGNAKGSAAVFDNAKIMGTQGTEGDDTTAGTAYCFSVVNVAEFMANTNSIVNANVAGGDPNSGAPHLLQSTDSEDPPHKQFKDNLAGGTNHHSGTNIVEAGASFDVVVHFKSEWCIRHWTIQDMQIAHDVGSNDEDYDLYSDPNPRHAHTDVADKRFPLVGICGCCVDNSGTGGDEERLDDAALSGGDPTAYGCRPCENRAVEDSCVEINTYADYTNTDLMWPNAGAWAGFYSFITCANDGFMIYDRATGYDLSTHAFTGVTRYGRTMVHSMFYNDIRHEHEDGDPRKDVVIRGNIRQIGEDVKVCGPGELLESNQRCTWNWNFRGDAGASNPQRWMHANEPDFRVWNDGAAMDRNTEAEAFDMSGYISTVTQEHDFAIHFQDDADEGPNDGEDTNDALTFDASKYFTETGKTISDDSHSFEITMHCLESSHNGEGDPIADAGAFGDLGDTATTNVRDMFPDCYMGDEIHFEYKITAAADDNTEHRINAWFSWVDTPDTFHE
jgi:hypothetical protein